MTRRPTRRAARLAAVVALGLGLAPALAACAATPIVTVRSESAPVALCVDSATAREAVIAVPIVVDRALDEPIATAFSVDAGISGAWTLPDAVDGRPWSDAELRDPRALPVWADRVRLEESRLEPGTRVVLAVVVELAPGSPDGEVADVRVIDEGIGTEEVQPLEVAVRFRADGGCG